MRRHPVAALDMAGAGLAAAGRAGPHDLRRGGAGAAAALGPEDQVASGQDWSGGSGAA